LRGAPGYVYPRRTLSPCGWDFIRTHIRRIDRRVGPARGTPSTACSKGWVGGKIFRSTNVMVVGMLCCGIGLFEFQLRSENSKVACSKSAITMELATPRNCNSSKSKGQGANDTCPEFWIIKHLSVPIYTKLKNTCDGESTGVNWCQT
jgi:hypothetical protein